MPHNPAAPARAGLARSLTVGVAAASLVVGSLVATAGASESIVGDLPDDLLVRSGPSGDVLSVLNPTGTLTEASTADPVDVVTDYLRRYREQFGLAGGGLPSLVLDSVISDPGGTTYVTFRQEVDGIEVFRAVITGAVDESGRLVHIGAGGLLDQRDFERHAGWLDGSRRPG